MNLVGINVVLTGASSGIGREIFKLLIELECNVIAVSRNAEEMNIVSDRVYLKNFDLKHEQEIDKLFDYAKETLGEIDLFIADAGYGYYERILGAEYAHIEDIFRLNSIGLFYSALKMKQICKTRPYNFVALGSGLSFLSLPGYALYSSTKAAIRGFADAYRFELRDDQFFQVVYPISTETKFYENAKCPEPPKPMQSPQKVAKTIIRGIEQDKKEIYPSKSFRFMKNFTRFLFKIPINIEKKKFNRLFR